MTLMNRSACVYWPIPVCLAEFILRLAFFFYLVVKLKRDSEVGRCNSHLPITVVGHQDSPESTKHNPIIVNDKVLWAYNMIPLCTQSSDFVGIISL